MSPALNPYTPGAGAPPPELAGRDALLAEAELAVARTRAGRHAKGLLMLGLRGVGKTVLLNEIEQRAERDGAQTVSFEAPDGRALAQLLVPPMRRALRRLKLTERVKDAFRAVHSFASHARLTVEGIEYGLAPPGVADSGDLDLDLTDLFLAVGEAARDQGTAVVLLVDEVQYLSESDLGALIVAIHKVTQRQLPLVLFGAGLPQLAGLAGNAKSYAERLFDYPPVGSLDDLAARRALREPAREAGADYEDDALDALVGATQGYPYFLQEWGKHTWNAAPRSPITRADVQAATPTALAALDDSFFRVRLDRLTPREKDYVRAMAGLGPGPHRSGEIADALGIRVQTAGPLRDRLIRKGMIYSPAHGDTAFTVPMFDAFLRRVMP
jgi:DNA-binding CsgD family transcriptional regulator